MFVRYVYLASSFKKKDLFTRQIVPIVLCELRPSFAKKFLIYDPAQLSIGLVSENLIRKKMHRDKTEKVLTP